MANCCDPTPYRRFFNRKEAARNVRSYRRRGLDPMASSMVEHLIASGVDELDVLEVGGGIGAIQLELLKAGVARTTNVELSAGYEEAAAELADEEGVAGRITRRVGDFVEDQDEFAVADIVVMNRVVCCYPWMERMMEAAVAKTSGRLALTFPREKWWVKVGLGVGNRLMAMRNCEFRAFVHPVAQIESAATEAGFVVRHADHNLIWHALVLERPLPE